MEEDRISLNGSKKRKYSQSLNKIFEDYNIVFDDDKDLHYESKIKKLETSEKINLIEKINEDKEIIKSKKKKIEGTVQAIKTFCRIRPSDSKNGNLFFLIKIFLQIFYKINFFSRNFLKIFQKFSNLKKTMINS